MEQALVDRMIFTLPMLAKRWKLSIKDISKIIIENNIWTGIWLEGETIVSGHHGDPNIPKQIIVDTLTRLEQLNLRHYLLPSLT